MLEIDRHCWGFSVNLKASKKKKRFKKNNKIATVIVYEIEKKVSNIIHL